VSEKIQIGEYLAILQARPWLSHALCALGKHETITFLLVTLPNIRQFKEIT